jgi:hypothetical protein
MNAMNMPGFTAETSLYMGRGSYCGNINISKVGVAMVIPQQDPGCTVLCSDWRGCISKCGAWPPGYNNADCWLNCLKPSTDCLQRTCGPVVPPKRCSSKQQCCGTVNPDGTCDGTCWPKGLECP